MRQLKALILIVFTLQLGFQPSMLVAAPTGSVPGRGSEEQGPLPLETLVPPVAGLTPTEIQNESPELELARSLEDIANEHAREAKHAPREIKALRARSVGEYFPSGIQEGSAEWHNRVERLVQDASTLHNYFESVSNPQTAAELGLKKDFIKNKLEPFIRSLSSESLRSSYRKSRLAQPIGEWSIETLVVTQSMTYLARFPNFTKNAMNLVSGKHLRGATYLAGTTVMLTVIGYAGTHLGINWTLVSAASLGFLGSSLLGGFNAGTVGPIMSALTGWGVRPTTERINKWNARITGRLEERINLGYDKAEEWFQSFSRTGKPGAGPDTEQNHTPNVARVEEHGFGVAGMTEEQQARNWTKNLRMWVTVAKRFSQLLSDTYHHGRVLMMIAWHDEQSASAIIETIDTKLEVIAAASEALLDPYKAGITANHARSREERRADLESLELAYDRYVDANEQVWRDPQLDESGVKKAMAKVEMARLELTQFGLTARDINKMDRLQFKYARAVRSIVTACAINEIRSFMTAEANRNLEAESRRAVVSVRRGFGLQYYTDKHLLLIQERIREMGYEIGPSPGAGARQCSELFVPTR